MMTNAQNTDSASWNERILANPDGGSLFQGFEFAEQKKQAGWTVRYETIDNIALTILEKRVLGIGKIWYLPKGPGVNSTDQLAPLLSKLKDLAKKHHVFTVKIEPELENTETNHSALASLGLMHTRPIQPNNNTVYVDIAPDKDTILKSLNQKGRHAIRRAERDGVTVKQVPTNDENMTIMYDLFKATADGAGFGIRPKQYYLEFWKRYADADLGQLFFAYADGEIVAGAFAIVFGKKSTYKDGASVRERNVYGASHLLQWHVMLWAKSRGSLTHDLCGTPSNAELKDTTHPYYGIGRFKTSFNKHITEYVGAWQVPIDPLRSKVWTLGLEKLIRKIYYKIHHQSFY